MDSVTAMQRYLQRFLWMIYGLRGEVGGEMSPLSLTHQRVIISRSMIYSSGSKNKEVPCGGWKPRSQRVPLQSDKV